MSTPLDLDTPILLCAMPQVVDPFFHQSVILLVRHQEEGSQGFIVNRPTEVKISDILEGLEVDWSPQDESVAHFGGPVQPQLGTLIYRDQDGDVGDTQLQIVPGLLLTQHLGDLQSVAEDPPHALRFLLGYAGWEAGQLTDEILRNDWITAPFDTEILFCKEPGSAWERALRSVGIDPAQLPTWTPDSGTSAAN